MSNSANPFSVLLPESSQGKKRRKKKSSHAVPVPDLSHPPAHECLVDEKSSEVTTPSGQTRYSADGSLQTKGLTLQRTLSSASSLGRRASEKKLRVITGIQAKEEFDINFGVYWKGETVTKPKELKKDVLRETERDKVYNMLLRVPIHLERFTWVSVLVCFDCLLGLITMLPFRCARDFLKKRFQSLKGNELFDFVLLCILLIGVYIHLSWIAPSKIYFGMKDITSEFLKLTLIHVALYMADQILCNLGVDVMEALSGTCTLFSTSEASLMALIADSLVTLCTVLLHSVVIMCSAMVWYVAMASSATSVLGFLIVSNFGEIKGTVMKRVDPAKLLVMTCQDVVERFHLIITALFIMVEDMGQNSSKLPRKETVASCALIILSESLVDVIKHAVLGKFSDIRPGIYREYLRDLFQKTMSYYSHNMHRFLIMEPLGPGILFIRVVVSAWFACVPQGRDESNAYLLIMCGVFGLIVALKVLLGLGLRKAAVWYLMYFEKNHGRTPRVDAKKKGL